MKKTLTLLLACLAVMGTAAESGGAPAGAFATGKHRNLFAEFLGKTDAETDAKIQAAWDVYFHGDPHTQRLFFPIADGLAYIPDVGNRDVRTEGLSYGMMICVQLNHQAEFNQLWKFARHFMYHERGPMRGYFTWHTAYDGSMKREDGSMIKGDGPAPDGEQWFVMALFFASHRWGDGQGILNYAAEAQAILHTMIHKDDDPDRGTEMSMFDPVEKQIRFTPESLGTKFTDASYHLPAFYALWTRWAADPRDRTFLAEVTATSRRFFHRAAHPQTGLMANYSDFQGHGIKGGWWVDEFREDAWRTLSNPAVDWAWWAADPWQVEEANRVLGFFAKQPPDNWPNHYRTDGTPLNPREDSPGLHAMAAVAGLAADPAIARPFIQQLWDLKIPDDNGRNCDGLRKPGELRSWRYYDGLLYFLALLEVGGRFRIYAPPSVQPLTP